MKFILLVWLLGHADSRKTTCPRRTPKLYPCATDRKTAPRTAEPRWVQQSSDIPDLPTRLNLQRRSGGSSLAPSNMLAGSTQCLRGKLRHYADANVKGPRRSSRHTGAPAAARLVLVQNQSNPQGFTVTSATCRDRRHGS